MSKVLYRYSSADTVVGDTNTPYTYKEWVSRNSSLIAGEEYTQYNQYLNNWYDARYEKKEESTSQLKEDYVSLIRQLQVIFENEDDLDWFSDIDFTDDLEIENAIPFYARKLKEIAIYLVNKRNSIKRAKLKYNLAGAYNSIERLFYEHLLKAFTKRDYVLNVPDDDVYDTFPELSSVNSGFSIKIEELYDDTQYLDKDPTVALSAYFEDSSLHWLFETGMQPLCADNPLLWVLSDMVSTMPLSSFEAYDITGKLNDYNRIALSEKYMGAEQYYVSGGYYVDNVQNVELPFQVGNNWFYWPSGEYIRETEDTTVFDPIYLKNSSLITNGASANTDYAYADKIFVQSSDTTDVSGAWLRLVKEDTVTKTMSANINQDITNGFSFRFPYPDYGIAAEGLAWSGPSMSNLTYEFYYLTEEQKKDVLGYYWSMTDNVSSFDPISIHDTNLIDNGAYAAKEYHNADKIEVRLASNADQTHDDIPDNIYKDSFDRAWLYDMDKTDLPIKVGQTKIYWPFQTYETEDDILITAKSNQCSAIALSSIDAATQMIGSRAGHSLFDSDIIYKLNTSDGYPVECAFLSGNEITELASSSATLMYGATGVTQPSLSLRIRPDNNNRFIWYGENTDISETSFTHKPHQLGCPYRNQTHKSIYDTRDKTLVDLDMLENGIANWDSCTCRSIMYSPLGHPSSAYEDYSKMADIIFLDTQVLSGDFDISTWVDLSGNGYNTSPDFAFYTLTGNNLEVDVGWGSGYWKTGSGDPFVFKKGNVYQYVRSNLLRNASDIIVNAVPNLIVREEFPNVETRWVKSILSDGEWIKTTEDSDMVINSGDYLVYDHVDSNWFCLSSIGTYTQLSAYEDVTYDPLGSPWTVVSYTTTGYDVTIEWPNVYSQDGPDVIAEQLEFITWELSGDNGITYQNVKSQSPTFIFTAEEVGTYTVNATGYVIDDLVGTLGASYIATNIPQISAVTQELFLQTDGSYDTKTVYVDTINYAMNVDLVSSLPYWAKAYDDSSEQTKTKGVMKWGGGIQTPIDNYTFITQPDIATLTLSADSHIKYNRLGTSSFTWVEPIDFKVSVEDKTWCDLIMSESVVSPLSGYLNNITNEMVLSASEEESDLILNQDTAMLVNYWCNSAFTWTQELTDSSLGFPPTGGILVPESTGLLIDPLVPCANLKNMHYPTIASIPDTTVLYTEKDVGGYFLPKNLGTSTFYSRGVKNDISVNHMPISGVYGTYRDPSIYGVDSGFTNSVQNIPLSTTGSDVYWIKGSPVGGIKSGLTKNARTQQDFTAYQSKYETYGTSDIGLNQQDDVLTPWIGDEADVWADPKKWPPDFRGIYNIEKWYSDLTQIQNVKVSQWKSDIFGNEYYLLKPRSFQGVYEENHTTGEVYVRTKAGNVDTLENSITDLYTFAPVISGKDFLDIDLWFDVLMLRTEDDVVFAKLNIEYGDDTTLDDIYATSDKIITESIPASASNDFGGVWFKPEDKLVTYVTMHSSSYIYPEFKSLDLNDLSVTTLINQSSANTVIQSTSALAISSYETPVFTYNNMNGVYNLSFICYSSIYESMLIESINISTVGDICEYKDIKVITPNA